MLNILAAAGAALSLFSPLAAPWDTVPPPTDSIVIDVVTVNGSGCRPGTAAVAVSPDNKAFTVTYSDYNAIVGPGYRLPDARKNCQINLQVHVPGGYTFGIAEADYRGYADLAKGATATQKANYYFQGSSQNGSVEHAIKGKTAKDWIFSDDVPVDAIVYRACGVERNLNINTELKVNAGTSDKKETSYIAMDSTDGAITTLYHFSWMKCNKK
jgi:hypothetical protein